MAELTMFQPVLALIQVDLLVKEGMIAEKHDFMPEAVTVLLERLR